MTDVVAIGDIGVEQVAPARERPMRVAMVIQRFRPLFSGQGEQLEALCRELAGRGHELTVLTSAYDRPSSTEESGSFKIIRLRSGLPLRGASRFGYSPVFAARVLAHLVSHPTYDLVHVHALTDALYSAWTWGRLEQHPVVLEMTLAGVDDAVTLLRKSQRWQRFRNHVVKACDGYVAISPALAAAYAEAGLPANKLRVIPQGVDVDRFLIGDHKAELRRSLALSESGPLVIFVGSLIHRKGLDVLLRSWPLIRAGQPEAQLALVGRDRFDDSSATAFLEAQLAQLSPDDRTNVHRLGIRDDVHRLMQAADVFALPSRQEGFGTVMIEAMASGLPCVVAELPGITDFIFGTAGDRGVIFPQGDDRALAESVISVLADSPRATRLGRAARDDVLARFAITIIADRYLAFYRDLLSGRGVTFVA